VLAAAAQAAGDMAVVGVTVLTSHEAGDFEAGGGPWGADLGFEAERLGRLALAAGLRGVVASGHEVTLLRETLGPEPWIVVPGVRTPSDAVDDQARTISVADAVGRGATHLGRGASHHPGRRPAWGVPAVDGEPVMWWRNGTGARCRLAGRG